MTSPLETCNFPKGFLDKGFCLEEKKENSLVEVDDTSSQSPDNFSDFEDDEEISNEVVRNFIDQFNDAKKLLINTLKDIDVLRTDLININSEIALMRTRLKDRLCLKMLSTLSDAVNSVSQKLEGLASSDLSKSVAITLGDRELEKLKNELQEKRLARDERKHEERLKKYGCKRCGSATETETESEEDDDGHEYYVEEIDSSQEDSDTAEEKRRIRKYQEDKLYRRYLEEKSNPAIFLLTMHEGEESYGDEDLLEDESEETESDVSKDSDDSYRPLASSGSEYSDEEDD
ncbi:glutamic acid-rich protein-like [Papaver somniferum]|uniref:glutamic acid-rich protein-like n=1 Tax=Papaver somniferum TaxID=3469 RepID=UPI000E6F5AFB|nr:glutamic acid-rich protein-like [Papaver somniferum]